MGLEMFSLEGKTALVTGASRGIGSAIAIAFGEAGADVAASARSVEDIEAVAGKVQASGRKGVAIPCDVTDRAQVRTCVDEAIARLGRIDILVNNAGGTRFMAPVVATREDGWEKIIRLNLDAVFLFSKYVGEHMISRGTGSIINISSVGGVRSSPAMAAYGAAKAGVLNLTRSMAREFGAQGPRVNAIAPGWVRTDLNRNLWEDPQTSAAMMTTVPMARWGDTKDIVGAAIYLASEASAYTTGSTIVVDGGVTA
jgi:NAD(P)-dependent dehydrogenase (short-subunit alcohol dehydrogenase family)